MTRVRVASALLGAGFGFLLSWAHFVDPDQICRMLLLQEPYMWEMFATAVAVGFVAIRLMRRVGVRSLLTGELGPFHPGVTPITTAAYDSAAGGYTRVVKLGARHGDAAALSVVELVERAGAKTEKAPAKKPARRRAPAKGKQPAPPRRRRAAAG